MDKIRWIQCANSYTIYCWTCLFYDQKQNIKLYTSLPVKCMFASFKLYTTETS